MNRFKIFGKLECWHKILFYKDKLIKLDAATPLKSLLKVNHLCTQGRSRSTWKTSLYALKDMLRHSV